MKKLWIIILVILAITAILIYFNLSGNKTQMTQQLKNNVVPQKGNSVEISNFSFVPETKTVKKGSAVVWTNLDQTIHQIKIGDSIVSQQMGIGESFSYTFGETGEIDYTCGIHPSMKGKVIIE